MQTTHTAPRRRGVKDYLLVSARGFCMGAADVVPGVSGGTMAFILGIYEELLHAIHAVNLDLMRLLVRFRLKEALDHLPWKFLLALVLGIAAAIFSLAEGLSWALSTHPTLVWAFFFGLVLASVITVRKRVSTWRPGVILTLVIAAASAYLLIGLVPLETPNEPWFLFLSGATAICAMILPGISGAFILVLLGKYEYVLNAVISRDLLTLLIVISGALVGLLSFARLLRWLFHKYHDLTVAGLMGLMIGSLRKVWPWKAAVVGSGEANAQMVNILPDVLNLEVGLAVGLAIGGIALVLSLEYLANRHTRHS